MVLEVTHVRNMNEKMKEIFERNIENIRSNNQNLLKPEHVFKSSTMTTTMR